MDAQEQMRQFEYAAAVAARAGGTPYLAVCFACGPMATIVPMTYATAAARDAWAVGHAAVAGHRVERYDGDGTGAVVWLPATRPRQGATGAVS